MKHKTLESRIDGMVLEYARNASRAPRLPLDHDLSLRDDLAIESLSLATLLLRLAEELDLDLWDQDVNLSRLRTVGDLIEVGRSLELTTRPAPHG